ncbi:hypothetical protein EJB05_58105, partial [Eragrostis curvula]
MAAAVEMSAASRVMGTVRWFNATKGSGFVTPDIGGEYLYFHQPSLKSDGIRVINVGDSVEFEVRANNYGSPKAFDITGSDGGAAGCFCPNGSDHGGGNGCYSSELAGGFHADGGDRGHGGMLCGGDGNRDCVGGGYGISSGRGCHNHEQGALPVLSEGALPVFDQMPLESVIWDEDGLHDFEDTAPRVFDEMPSKDDTTGQARQIAFLVPLSLESSAQEVFDDMSHKDVMWDEPGNGLDLDASHRIRVCD